MRLDSASRAYCKCRAWVYKLAHMTTAYDVGEIIPPIGVHHRLRIAREWANLEQSELTSVRCAATGVTRTGNVVRLHTRRQSCIVIYMSNEMSTGLVTMSDDAMDAWLGPVELTSEQRERFAAIWDDVDGRYPDDADAATAALSAAVQYLVGETRPEDAGREIARLAASLEDARAAARAVAVLAIADGESESALAARMGVTRMTVRKWLDKG